MPLGSSFAIGHPGDATRCIKKTAPRDAFGIEVDMGECQNYGPFLGTLSIKCRIIIGIQKETIILTTTHILKLNSFPLVSRRLQSGGTGVFRPAQEGARQAGAFDNDKAAVCQSADERLEVQDLMARSTW